MAKYQYRIHTDSLGTSNYGFAYLALMNPSGSGKKLTIRSLEVFIQSSVGTAISALATLYRSTGNLSGENIAAKGVNADSSFSVPSGLIVRRNATYYSGTLTAIHRWDINRRAGNVGNQNRLLFGTALQFGKRARRSLGGFYNGSSGGYNNESVTLNNGESFAVMFDAQLAPYTTPVRVCMTINVNGKTIQYDFITNPMPGTALVAVKSGDVSTTIKLIDISVTEVGTTDTPTLRIVPIGQLYAPDINDTCKQLTVTISKMDTSYPSFSGVLYSDIGFIPQGVPEVAISPASAGTPQGMNYLHTRDFWGPMYRNFLVEMSHMRGAQPDMLGISYNHDKSDLLFRRAGITLNQGEGIAIVNSAETAVAVQAAYGGWQPLTFGLQVDVEPAASPYLSLSGIIPGSDIVILQPGTSTELQNIDAYSSSSWAWNYDPDIVTGADVCVYKQGYVPFTVRNLSLTSAGASIPVQQVTDRNFSA